MIREDLEQVFAVQCRAHAPDYHEPVEALASRLESGGDHCFVAAGAEGLAAYLLAHPWRGSPPALHRPLICAGEPDHLFLHDLAVAPECRGQRVAVALLEALLAKAQGRRFAEIRLVALAGAQAFWLAHGWRAQAAPLAGAYGEGACLMSRSLG
ncbi:GNAT family N-acetyltransferase [Niveibacterium terrae]|uniref:GNAT family N-acetyltransferase n=1 Tax=Niveibacterium terrae TaxID=3373598 RepID=UPI003A92704F